MTSSGATPRFTSAIAGSSRSFRAPERTTTASARLGVDAARGQTNKNAQAASQAARRPRNTRRRRRIIGTSEAEPGTLSAG